MATDELSREKDFVQRSNENSWKRTVYVAIALVFALVLAGYLIYKITVAVLVLLVTLLFSIIISAPVDYLNHRGVGRGWATLAVLGGLVVVFGIAGAALVPIIEDQAVELAETFPELLENAQQIVVGLQGSLGIETSFRLDPQRLIDSARSFLLGGTLRTVASVGASVASILSFVVVILIATVYAVA